jgi:hypothetical protein
VSRRERLYWSLSYVRRWYGELSPPAHIDRLLALLFNSEFGLATARFVAHRVLPEHADALHKRTYIPREDQYKAALVARIRETSPEQVDRLLVELAFYGLRTAPSILYTENGHPVLPLP